MTKETKLRLLLDEYEAKKEKLKREYCDKYDKAYTSNGILKVNYDYAEKDNELEKWFIQSTLEICRD